MILFSKFLINLRIFILVFMVQKSNGFEAKNILIYRFAIGKQFL